MLIVGGLRTGSQLNVFGLPHAQRNLPPNPRTTLYFPSWAPKGGKGERDWDQGQHVLCVESVRNLQKCPNGTSITAEEMVGSLIYRKDWFSSVFTTFSGSFC